MAPFGRGQSETFQLPVVYRVLLSCPAPFHNVLYRTQQTTQAHACCAKSGLHEGRVHHVWRCPAESLVTSLVSSRLAGLEGGRQC